MEENEREENNGFQTLDDVICNLTDHIRKVRTIGTVLDYYEDLEEDDAEVFGKILQDVAGGMDKEISNLYETDTGKFLGILAQISTLEEKGGIDFTLPKSLENSLETLKQMTESNSQFSILAKDLLERGIRLKKKASTGDHESTVEA